MVSLPAQHALKRAFHRGTLVATAPVFAELVAAPGRDETFVESFFEDDKPVAAICHGPVMLIEADVVEGRELTSYPSIRTDLENAGADWIDQETVLDGNLLTSRRPDDLPAFTREMIKLFAERKAETGGGLRTD